MSAERLPRAAADVTVDAGGVDPADGVWYYSRQNDCLRTEAPMLLEDVSENFPWGVAALNGWTAEELHDAMERGDPAAAPEAVNLWVGDDSAVSTVHKDPFENFYAVVCGVKRFLLLPPCDSAFLPEESWPSCRYRQQRPGAGPWSVVAETDEDGVPERTPWIPVDPEGLLHDDTREAIVRRFPLMALAHPVVVEVAAGDVLYLPALWLHRVSARGRTVSVNFWFDMDMLGHRMASQQLFSALGRIVQGLATGGSAGEDPAGEEAGALCTP